MPGVFVFTRTKGSPFALFVGPFRRPIKEGNMADIQISNVQGLQSILNGKAPNEHRHSWAQIDDKPSFAATNHTHTIQQVDGLGDALGAKVGSSTIRDIWSGSQAQYDALQTKVSTTLYVITGGGPGATNHPIGTPLITTLVTAAATNITPTLPTLTDEWGYLAIIQGQNALTNNVWPTTFNGWTKLADQALTDGGFSARPMALYKAPAGTPTAAFASPAGGSQRYVAMVFPVKTEPHFGGMVGGRTQDFATPIIDAQAFTRASYPMVIGTMNYSSVTSAAPPSMTDTQYTGMSGPAMVSGSGSATVLAIGVGPSAVASVASKTYTIDPAMASGPNTWRVGIGF